MTFSDWRDARPEDLAPVYALERGRWLTRLAWDPAPALAIVERGRSGGYVPGFIARETDGTIAGWTFFVLHHRVLQIGGLVARTGELVRRLLEHALKSPEAEAANEVSCFVLPGSNALESALLRRRFAVVRYRYLRCALQGTALDLERAARPVIVRPWHAEDGPACVRLLARAYAGSPAARCFAPNARLEEWAQYLGQLIATPACGQFDQSTSAIVPGPGTGVSAALIATRVAPGTAHVAQVAVDPGARRQGLGRALLLHALARARAAGDGWLSLLVADDNASAMALYGSLGFEPVADFLYARRSALRRPLHPPITFTEPALADATA